MSTELTPSGFDPQELLDICRSHADIARAAHQSRDHEVALLKGRISILEHQLGAVRAENIGLRAELRKIGIRPVADYVQGGAR